MKFISVLALCAMAAVAFGAAYLSEDSSAGNYAGKSYDPAPVHAPAPASEQAPDPYTAPASAPYTAPAPYSAPTPTPYTAPSDDDYKALQKTEYEAPVKDTCWTETKKCCWKEKTDGYECKDNYTTKQARCHPKIMYERKCDKATNDGKPDKPKEYVNYEQTNTVDYDDNYGSHVEGYPSGGTSDTYDSKKLPEKPYGVEAEPYKYVAPTAMPAYTAPPSTDYKAPAPASVSSDTGYSTNGYEGAPAPAPAGY